MRYKVQLSPRNIKTRLQFDESRMKKKKSSSGIDVTKLNLYQSDGKKNVWGEKELLTPSVKCTVMGIDGSVLYLLMLWLQAETA